MRNDLDPGHHLAVGRVLSPLRQQGTLIVGSGMSYHNMQTLMTPDKEKPGAREFDNWLQNACANHGQSRKQLLCNWQSAPVARQAHPREEHLLPLMIAAGAAEDEAGITIYQDIVLGAQVSAIQFGKSMHST